MTTPRSTALHRTDLLRLSLLAIVAPSLAIACATSSGGASAAPTETPKFPCENPTPLVIRGSDTGYDVCAAGQTRRRAIVTCADPGPLDLGTPIVPCANDTECIGHGGYCALGTNGSRGCSYGCVSDATCPTGSICLCGEPIGYCVSSSCTSDASCATGLCSTDTWRVGSGCPAPEFSCQGANDECGGDKDCSAPGFACATPLPHGPRSCLMSACVSGRPFIVERHVRVAPLSSRRGWT